MSVGRNIKLFRINAGLKQKDLARLVGVNIQHLSAIENDKKEPSLSLLKKIAKELSVPLSIFFWEDTEVRTAKTSTGHLQQLLFELVKSYAKNKS